MSDLHRPARYFKRQYGISNSTLIRWEKKKRLRTLTTELTGHRLCHLADTERCLGVQQKTTNRIRVSSAAQKDNLARQVEDLQTIFQEKAEGGTCKLIQDIGSGVNFKRPGLRSLLDQVYNGGVSHVAVMHKDRLVRIGREVLEWVFAKHGTKLVVYGDQENTTSSDLAADLLAVTTVLVASHNGKRSA